jgi:hypothetical protein
MSIGFRAVALVDPCCWHHDGATHCTGEPGVSCPFDMYGANQISVFLETACQPPEPCLSLAVFFYNASTGRTSPPGILRHHGDEPTAFQASLSSGCLRNSNHPRSRMELFNRDFSLTFLLRRMSEEDSVLESSISRRNVVICTGNLSSAGSPRSNPPRRYTRIMDDGSYRNMGTA